MLTAEIINYTRFRQIHHRIYGKIASCTIFPCIIDKTYTLRMSAVTVFTVSSERGNFITCLVVNNRNRTVLYTRINRTAEKFFHFFRSCTRCNVVIMRSFAHNRITHRTACHKRRKAVCFQAT